MSRPSSTGLAAEAASSDEPTKGEGSASRNESRAKFSSIVDGTGAATAEKATRIGEHQTSVDKTVANQSYHTVAELERVEFEHEFEWCRYRFQQPPPLDCLLIHREMYSMDHNRRFER